MNQCCAGESVGRYQRAKAERNYVTKAPDQSARFCNHVNNNTITIYGQPIGPCPMMWNNANTDLHVSTCKLEM